MIQAGDGQRIVKVGISGHPLTRIAGIRASVPFPIAKVALVYGGKSAETEMKKLLAPWQVRGEWFLPRPELNDYLSEKRSENQLVEAVVVDQAYSDNFIRPAVLAYLNGRQPTFSDAGDLVSRFLHDGIAALADRREKLIPAIKHGITLEILRGFVPLPPGVETPQVWISDAVAA